MSLTPLSPYPRVPPVPSPLSPMSPLHPAARRVPSPPWADPASGMSPAVPKALAGPACVAGGDPGRVPPPPPQCHPGGDKPVPPQQPGGRSAQSLPPLCPQQWQCHVPGALSPPGGRSGDTGTARHGDRWPWGSGAAAAEGGMPAAGGLLCGASGLALLVAATATHFWVQRRAPGGTASLGLWHGCLGGQCHPHATTPALLEATRVLMLLSVVAAAAGLALGLSVGASGGRRARARVAGATLLLAGTWGQRGHGGGHRWAERGQGSAGWELGGGHQCAELCPVSAVPGPSRARSQPCPSLLR
ncbi:proline-rich receptor-like protein kinase PERK2 isoform X1 [Corvus moneduloides]|nr:proline-rich receptor-like protein kinase PERK2 isoform X1 [Corvus moneduloides]